MKKLILIPTLFIICLSTYSQNWIGNTPVKFAPSFIPEAVANLPIEYQKFANDFYNAIPIYSNDLITKGNSFNNIGNIYNSSFTTTQTVFQNSNSISIRDLISKTTTNGVIDNINTALQKYSSIFSTGKNKCYGDIQKIINQSNDFNSFNLGLVSVAQNITSGQYNLNSQDLMEVSYEIAMLESSMKMLSLSGIQHDQKNGQTNKAEACNWWCSWGKCAAGILGGAGMGALGGAAAGSVIPGVGTVAGGIVGGIAGGLSGAAAAC